MATTPTPIQAWAAAEAPVQTAINAALATMATTIPALASGVAALDTLITTLQNSPGTITPADQATLDAAVAQSTANLSQFNSLVTALAAINTAAPGSVPPAPGAAHGRK